MFTVDRIICNIIIIDIDVIDRLCTGTVSTSWTFMELILPSFTLLASLLFAISFSFLADKLVLGKSEELEVEGGGTSL